MADGTVSCEEFGRNVSEFLQVSSLLKDGWELRDAEALALRGCPYLVKRNVLRAPHIADAGSTKGLRESAQPEETGTDAAPRNREEEEDCPEDGDEDVDSRTPDGQAAVGVCRFDYHIVYNHSFSVPTLYFSACHEDGKILSLDEVWRSVPSHYQKRLQSERWTFITQQEHPILGRPFYSLHPCHTADLMKAVLNAASQTATSHRNYLVTWLSSVGPVVGLSLPLRYAKLCEKT
ncbi:ubiquitin-like-conjugating enzyme ATG10 [Acanthaster planci]|uniref:Ubiquitin-like-conjugating enzyme ATG10 n=1 Tax=Acanthaster planci TaxID=133434 RepID=A0A8B7ZAA9_ACAPL|nr:ubiquitin-like-conjugating enzyme ATG10 [Acanthaster planci]